MTRFAPLVLLALALPTFAAVTPIAPLATAFGDMPYDDVSPRAATDGASTLMVWANRGPLIDLLTYTINGIFVESDGAPVGPSFPIAANGIAPIIESNGDEYLVAYGVPIARSAQSPRADFAVRTVQRDGAVGQETALGSGLAAATPTGLLWAGDHWIVAYFDTAAHIAFLTRDLQPFAPTLAVAADSPGVRLVASGNHVFVFASRGAILHAYDIAGTQLVDLGTGPVVGGNIFAVPTASGAIVVGKGSLATIDVVAFSPPAGWSGVSQITVGLISDFVPFGGNFVFLSKFSHGEAAPLVATMIDASGTVLDTQTILPLANNASLLGSALFVSVPGTVEPRASGSAIVSFPISRLQPLVEEQGKVVSITRTDVQTNPLIVSAGSYAMAFWNQSIDALGTQRTFSRKLDASGHPIDDPQELPFTMGEKPHGAFDGTRLILTWSDGKIVPVSADGTTAGAVTGIGQPAEIEVAAANGARFGLWTLRDALIGSPLLESGRPLVAFPTPLLPSIRPQRDPDVAVLGPGFVAVWTEDTDIGAMVLSAPGTPSALRTIGTGSHPVVAGDGQTALAAWLSENGAPVLVEFGDFGVTSDPFKPHWGNHVDAVRLAPAGAPLHYFAGLLEQGNLFVAEMRLSGFIRAVGPLRLIAPVSSPFSLAGVQGNPIAVWEADRRVWIGTPEVESRRRSAHH